MKTTLVILVFLLFAVSSYAGTIIDDLSDGDMGEWHLASTGAGGDWKVEGGIAILEGAGGLSGIMFVLDRPDWKDYTVQVDMKITQHVVTALWEQSGLGLRFIKGKSGYYFSFGTPGVNAKKLRTYFTDFILMQNRNLLETPFDWQIDTWYTLKAEIKGNSFKYYVDDVLMMEYTNANGPNGGTGFGVTAATDAHFDNFSVTGDDVPDAVFSVDPEGKIAVVWGEIKSEI
ncbi:hypothetical protein GF312_04165 [Candidatus Poribacteria bacterium]|nr:hypothetical protein [Candidatus Poribacteria bacterium]